MDPKSKRIWGIVTLIVVAFLAYGMLTREKGVDTDKLDQENQEATLQAGVGSNLSVWELDQRKDVKFGDIVVVRGIVVGYTCNESRAKADSGVQEKPCGTKNNLIIRDQDTAPNMSIPWSMEVRMGDVVENYPSVGSSVAMKIEAKTDKNDSSKEVFGDLLSGSYWKFIEFVK